MRASALSLVHRMAGREPPRQAPADVDAMPVTTAPLPPRKLSGAFIARGQGPWQRKAMSMQTGQSLIVNHAQADAFRSACRRLGIKTSHARLDAERTQVQITETLPTLESP